MFRVILFLLYIYLVFGENCDELNCPNYGITNHYREVGCKPQYNNHDKCCPVKYDCSNLENWRTKLGHCFVKDKVYNNGDKVEAPEYNGLGLALCFCNGFDPKKQAKITCAYQECAEWFLGTPRSQYYVYSHDRFCAINSTNIPTSENGNSPIVCNVDGKVYYSGQRVWPKTKAFFKCICQNGELDCRPIVCGLALQEQERFLSNEVPVYKNLKDPCPVSFIKPLHGDKVGSQNSEQNQDSRRCHFGNLEFKFSDVLISSEERKCIQCDCRVPPLLTCMLQPGCN